MLTQKGTRNGSNPGINKCKVVITLPRQAALDSVQINSNVGDIKLADFIANEIGINLNVGEMFLLTKLDAQTMLVKFQ